LPSSNFLIGLYSRYFHTSIKRGVATYSHQLAMAMSELLDRQKLVLVDCFWPRASRFSHLPQTSNPNFETRIIRMPGRLFDFSNENLGWPTLRSVTRDLDILHVLHEQVPVVKLGNIVMTVHGMEPLFYPQLFSRDFRSRWKKNIDRSLERATKVIAVSETVEMQLRDYRPEFSEKYESVKHGVSSEFLAESDPEQEEQLLADRGIPFPYILFVGAADPKKNLIKFAKSFAIVLARGRVNSYHLVLVGNRNWGGYDQLMSVLNELGIEDRVHFTGYLENRELPALYRRSELFVFPALFEGFGLPLLEAMAAGAPCLASNRPALTEVGDEFVEYLDPDSEEDMAVKMESLLMNPDKLDQMRSRARQYARKFTWERTARKTLKIYEDLLGGSLIS